MARPDYTTGGIFTASTEALLRRDLAQAMSDRDRARAIAVTLEQEAAWLRGAAETARICIGRGAVSAADAVLWEALENNPDASAYEPWKDDDEPQTEPDHV